MGRYVPFDELVEALRFFLGFSHETSFECLTIYCRVMNISVVVAEFRIFLFFFGWLLWSFRELDYTICNPLFKNGNHLFHCARNWRWWLIKGFLGGLLAFSVSSRYSEKLWLAFLLFGLLNMWFELLKKLSEPRNVKVLKVGSKFGQHVVYANSY